MTLGTATGPLVFSHLVTAGQTAADVAAALAARINTLGPVEFDAVSEVGALRVTDTTGAVFTSSLSVDGVALPGDVEAAAAVIATRIDGINYYSFETLNIALGSGDDVFNIQGTTAITNIDLNGGDDALYVSSAANFGIDTAPDAVLPDFLSGHLHAINGTLNIDAGAGDNRLMISGESSTLDNSDIVISDVPLLSEPAGTEIAVRGLTGGDDAFGWVDRPQATITFQAAGGNFAEGVTFWSGFGDDTVRIDGTHDRTGVRTITTVNTGLGDDTVLVDLDVTEANGADTSDGVFVLNTQGPWNDYPGITDNDTVLGTDTVGGTYVSTLPLIVFGGQGNDSITGGSGDDILFGDRGRMLSFEDIGGIPTVVEALGSGGPGDVTDGLIRTPDQVFSVDPDVGGNDVIMGLEGDNILVGGFGNDTITAGAGADLALGDNGQIDWTPVGDYGAFQTTDLLLGGNDDIRVGDGDNLVAGGFGADVIETGVGADLILGDNGIFDYTTSTGDVVGYLAGEVQITVETADLTAALARLGVASIADLVGMTLEISMAIADTALGQARQITAQAPGAVAGTTVLTLDAAFVLESGAAGDILEYLIYSATHTGGVAVLTEASTTDTTAATGGNDVIVGGGGTADNIVLAGVGDDRVNQPPLAPGDPLPVLSTGVDIVIGDNGFVTWDGAGLMTEFASAELNLGGNDLIAVGDGNNIVVGGFGSDTITTGADADIVLGDNGAVSYRPDTTLLLQASTTDVVNGTGGGDTIDTGAGDNLVLAGVGADTVTTGDGVDLVMGDNGQFNWGATGLLESFTSTSPLMVGVDAGSQAAPDFADIDGDGDLDAVVGGTDGSLRYFENTGTAAAPNFVEILGRANPFNDIDVGTESAPVLADIDGDGDLDLVVGATDGTLDYFENTGTTAAPVFVEVVGIANPFDAIDVGSQSTPVFADIDGDGDLDLVVGATDGTLSYFENTGSALVAGFVEQSGAANPYDGIDVGGQSAPNFTDADNDGDLDLVVGTSDGTLAYYENIGSTLAPIYVEQTGAANPFDGIDPGAQSKPVFADLDGDGDAHVVVGDSGGTLSYFADAGGDDVIAAGDGANVVVGGYGNDTITTGTGVDIVLGDNGAVTYTSGTTQLLQAVSTDAANGTGGNDTIAAGEGDNLVLAGVGGDTVTTGDGVDLVMGDNGQFDWDSAGLLTGFASSDPTLGGNDQIVVGNGDNIVVAGFGDDTITTGDNFDIVLGDNGAVTYTPNTTLLEQAASTDTTNATGGDDTILAGEGDNLILAGVGADTVTTGGGVDLVMGDNGQIDWASNGEYSAFQTTDPLLGANDVIQAGDGDNIVAGGFGADQITVGLGEDLILGDNGIFGFMLDAGGAAVLTEARTTDLANGTGDDDTIFAGDGANVVLAGVGADTVSAGTGADIVIGDNGDVNWDTGGADHRQFGSSMPELGGDDLIDVGDGTNIVVGGFGADTILTGADADIVLGDDGHVDYVGTDRDSTDIDTITSTSTTAIGGADTITTLGGDDIVIGGRMDDVIDAGEGSNLVIGDSGSITAGTTDAPQLPGQPITLGVVQTTQPDDGGNDTITAGDGRQHRAGRLWQRHPHHRRRQRHRAGRQRPGRLHRWRIDHGAIDRHRGVDRRRRRDRHRRRQQPGDRRGGQRHRHHPGWRGRGDWRQRHHHQRQHRRVAAGEHRQPGAGRQRHDHHGWRQRHGDRWRPGTTPSTRAAGNDVLFGDGGQVTVSAGGTQLDIVSTDVLFGGDDTLDGGTGNDVIVGGQGNDLLYGSLSEDLVFGSNAAVTLVNGLVTSIFSDVQDLVTESLFALFNALPDEDQALLLDFFERLEEVSALLDAIDQPDPLLDVDLFRKLFALGAQARALLADWMNSRPCSSSDVVSEPEAPAHARLLDRDEAENGAGPDAGAPIVEADGGRCRSQPPALSALIRAATRRRRLIGAFGVG